MTKKTVSSKEPQKSLAAVSEFVERDEKGEQSDEIPYETLLKITPKERELNEEEEKQAQNIVFYCTDCQALRETQKKKGKKLKFICTECQGENIYFGSELGIRGYFYLKT